jgi:hypothetical protein
VQFDHAAPEDLDPSTLPRFHKIFPINVNLFWTRPAQQELALVRQLLTDGGVLHVCYDSSAADHCPSHPQLEGMREPMSNTLPETPTAAVEAWWQAMQNQDLDEL